MKTTSNQLRLITIFTGITLLLISPIIITQLNNPNPKIYTHTEIIQQQNTSKGELYSTGDSGLVLAETSSELQFPFSGIFGEKLLEELQDPQTENVNALVVFRNDISKSKQLSVLDLSGLKFSLIKQYQNFPIALIKTSLGDLQQSEEFLASLLEISKIFLDSSQRVDFQNLPSSAALVDEENWWLDTIGAKNLSFDGTGVRIAILDTGIYSDHADFASKTPLTSHINYASDEGSRNYSDYIDIHGHGTHVAGIAAGTGVSSSGKYIGVAPGASLLNVKTLNDYGSITDSDVVDAVDWIISQDNADIISMSFRTEAQNTVYNPISIALETAVEHGIVTVAAAGNDGPLHLSSIHPSTASSVISVGAINRDLKLTSFSSVGPSLQGNVIPDILAPGRDIIAPESLNSLIGRSERYTNSQILGSEPNSDYFAISGTSMSTPMVSGAIALILDAYPELTPEGVRAALYQGAYLPDHYSDRNGANGIGAGIINVSASIVWLDSLPDPYSIVQAFPDNLPYEPVDLISYPGDYQSFNISLFSAKNSSVSLDITIQDSQNIVINTSTTSVIYTNHSVQHVQFDMNILDNASVGLETGSILINDTGTGDLLEQIDYSINISYPIGRVYFDALHGLNDLYPEWSSGYSQIEIYNAMKTLHENGYQLIYEMENWTKTTQSQPESRLLSPDLLSTVDIVVLQTPIIGYSDLEKNALEEFKEKGGSILLLGTRSQTLAIDSLNSLLSHLNAEISIQNTNIFDYTDVGFGYSLDKHSVSDIDDTSPIFEAGDEFSYWYGPILEIEGDSSSIASLQGQSIVAAHESVSGGKVVVWSDYHWLRNDVFSVTNAVDHERILLNLFEYLNSQEENDYALTPNFNSTIQSDGNLELVLSIVDPSTRLPIIDRIYGDSLNASIKSPSDVITPLYLTSLGNGIYSNTTFNLGVSDYRPYIVQINVSSPSGLISREYSLYRIDGINNVEINNPYVSDYLITRSPGSSTTIHYSGSSLGLTSTLYGSISTDSFYSDIPLNEYSANLTPSGMDYSDVYSVKGDEPSGLFAFFAVASSPDNYTNFDVTRTFFYIDNNLPEIDEDESIFNTYPFSETRTESSLYILQVNDIGSIDLMVKVEETIGYESSTSELTTIAYYTAAASAGASFDVIYPDSIPTSLIPYDSEQDSFVGDFKLPKSLTFSGSHGSVEVSQQSEDQNEIVYFSVLWITVRDTDGGVVDYLFLLYVNIVFDWNSLIEYLPLITVVVAVIAITVVILAIVKKRKQKLAPQSQYSEIPPDNVYCMHCGKQIDNTYLVCPYCGKQLP